MNKTYRVTLTAEERDELETLIHTGKAAARTLTHARILLKADQQDTTGPAWTDVAIAEALEVSRSTVARVRERFVEAGMDVALHRKAAVSTRLPKIDGDVEARLITLTCGDPPEGRTRWTLRLLAERLVQLDAVPFTEVSHETIRQVLKKTNSSPG
jgi:transposase